jgi:hypothetical protein
MHISKFAAQGNRGDSTPHSIGSYAIAGIFRTLWTLGRLKDEQGKPTNQRAPCASKNNHAESGPPALLFELHGGFHWDGVNADIFAEDLYCSFRPFHWFLQECDKTTKPPPVICYGKR